MADAGSKPTYEENLRYPPPLGDRDCFISTFFSYCNCFWLLFEVFVLFICRFGYSGENTRTGKTSNKTT